MSLWLSEYKVFAQLHCNGCMKSCMLNIFFLSRPGNACTGEYKIKELSKLMLFIHPLMIVGLVGMCCEI